MKIKFDLLYKNGFHEEYTLDINEEKARQIATIMSVVEESFREDVPGHITLGDSEVYGMHIRVSDLSRLKTTILGDEEENMTTFEKRGIR